VIDQGVQPPYTETPLNSTRLESMPGARRRSLNLFRVSTIASLGAAVCFLAVGKAALALSFGAMTLLAIPITLLLGRRPAHWAP
jgi:hypothetical protein